MSRETAGIIAFAKAFDATVIVTATTNGVHTALSYHFKAATDGKGRAVDFDFVGMDRANRRLALARHFEKVGNQLAELFYTPLGHSWKYGKLANFTIPNHMDHIHVAVELGVFLDPVSEQPQEEDMPDKTSSACMAPSGRGRWVLDRDGAVRSYNFDDKNPIPHHGSMFDYPNEQKVPGRYFIDIEPVGILENGVMKYDDSFGYFIHSNDGFTGKFKK